MVIGYLEGEIVDFDDEQMTLMVQGVGYELHCLKGTLSSLQVGEKLQMWVYTHVREDHIHLFGFSQKSEREIFLSLIGVSGIGPKMAIAILSHVATDPLIKMIEQGDVKGLCTLPKIGKKTAEQMILSLKGKLHGGTTAVMRGTSALPSVHSDMVSALVHLGYRLSDVHRAVEALPKEIEFQEGIRRCLAQLSEIHSHEV